MGALQSIQEYLPVIGEETTDKSTPAKPTNKRLLSLDPRSPSETIQRTPIVVEKTPIPRLSMSVAQQTQMSGSRIEDPRSPTADFTRTPINPCLAGGERQGSRLKPIALDSLPSTVTLGSESGIESAEVTPVKDKDMLSVERLESPDSAFSADEAHSDQNVASNEGESTTSSPLDADTSDDSVRKPLMAEKSKDGPTEGTPKLPVARARPQALSKLSRLVIEGNKASESRTVTRSPLSNVANARVVLGSHQNKRRSSEAGAVLSAGWDKENKTGVL